MESETLSAGEAVAMLADGPTVHTFVCLGGLLLGADWGRSQAEEHIRAAGHTAQRSGPLTTSVGHGLAVTNPAGEVTFFETRRE